MNSHLAKLVLAAVGGACVACQAQSELIASRFVKSVALTAAHGGTLEVTPAESEELAGTRLVVRPGSLDRDVTVTVTLQRQAIASAPNEAAGPVAVFGPAGLVFHKPVEVTLPYSLPGRAAAQDLYAEVLEENGARLRLEPVLLDRAGSRVTFSVDRLARVQAAVVGCRVDEDCSAQHACVDGRCRPRCGKSACPAGESCVEGVCTPGCGGACETPPGPCFESPGQCDLDQLRCVYAPAGAGLPCSDGRACTAGDVCDGWGNCAGSESCGYQQSCGGSGECVCNAGYVDCDGNPANGCEREVAQCDCPAETEEQFCARHARACGPLIEIDNCGALRTAQCGTCGESLECLEGRCEVIEHPESDQEFCERHGIQCGPLDALDNFRQQRHVAECGPCAMEETCSAEQVCVVVGAQTDVELCVLAGAECGAIDVVDSTGTPRHVDSCGQCESPLVCDGNRCKAN